MTNALGYVMRVINTAKLCMSSDGVQEKKTYKNFTSFFGILKQWMNA